MFYAKKKLKNSIRSNINVELKFIDLPQKYDLIIFILYKFQACQLHREFYKGYSKSPHPLDYFNESPYKWQCPPEISPLVFLVVFLICTVLIVVLMRFAHNHLILAVTVVHRHHNGSTLKQNVNCIVQQLFHASNEKHDLHMEET